jgi:hypothetical protein
MIMALMLVSLLIIIVLPVIAMINTIFGTAVREQEVWESKYEKENKDLENNLKSLKEERENEELFWFILANLRLNEQSLNEKKIVNKMMDTYEEVRVRDYFDEQFHLKAKNIIITYYEIENVDKLSEYSVDRHFKLRSKFIMEWMYKISIGSIADLDFLKEKILRVQPERKAELEKLIKKEKLKTIFIK